MTMSDDDDNDDLDHQRMCVHGKDDKDDERRGEIITLRKVMSQQVQLKREEEDKARKEARQEKEKEREARRKANAQ